MVPYIRKLVLKGLLSDSATSLLMAFSVRETIGGWAHMLRRWQRSLGAPADKWIEPLHKRGLDCKRVTRQSQPPYQLNCDFCGFSMAEFSFDDNWSLEICSALAFDRWKTVESLSLMKPNLSELPRTNYTTAKN